MKYPPHTVRIRPRGVTIGMLMKMSVVVGVALWLARPKSLETRLALGLLAGFALLIVSRGVAIAIDWRRCPGCAQNGVQRVKTTSFGPSFFHCTECGQRLKRYGMGRYWDASGVEDARRFESSNRPVATWSEADSVPSNDPAARTVSNLLREKLDRKAMAAEAVSHHASPLGYLDPRSRTSLKPKPYRGSGVHERVALAMSRIFGLRKNSR